MAVPRQSPITLGGIAVTLQSWTWDGLWGGMPKKQQAGVPKVKTCETYKNKKGETCYKGTRQLRKSELLILR